MGGIIAPPQIAKMISPDISFAYLGFFSTVIVKTNGKIFENPSPVINNTILVILRLLERIIPINPARVNIVL